MARRRQAAERVGSVAPDSSEDEAPEEVAFGVAKEAAEVERKLVGEAARRHKELLKEKRRRRQELFTEQKKRKRLPEAVLQELAAAPPARPAEPAAAANRAKRRGGRAAKQRKSKAQKQVKKGKQGKGKRSIGNYTAVCLKDQSATGLHQQLARDFLNTQLYGPGTNRVQANEFFSLENKRNPVKKAAVQFVDKTWGEKIKQKATRWLSAQFSKGT
ncbi:nucleolar protein 7 [Pogoniulus pusillus]|uniref:nucleolar protein 7 n=1 Tax=Pogoniulus pusillus TaxID=488313 RepID=UPI0030B92459